MTVEEIEELAARCASAGIHEIEISEVGFSLRLRIQPGDPVRGPAVKEEPRTEPAFQGVRAPGVGVFRLVHPSTGRPVVEPGQTVRKGDVVGVLQVGPALKAVVAPADGILGPALRADGAVVGYGEPLHDLL